ncbi:tumor necrosis factor ligand superfamily member 15-like [Hypanus sabinus]|uniref:tumor necrosis factor ligand superfamily member 15-like n=1 Tax=Hypanus sabinus TaxID=79690 RepID=UPI0028C46D67|nr:tumor necrosis factor ligand superfamily member 15-like [Hypanus sabinus]
MLAGLEEHVLLREWLAIAGMCIFIFFYIDVLKKDINNQVLIEMKNFSLPSFQPTGSGLIMRAQNPIAHLTAFTDFQNSSNLLFETSLGHAFHTPTMTWNKTGYLVIPTSGVYFLYAQVTFNCAQDCLSHAHQFYVSISKKTKHYPAPEKLLKSYARPQAKAEEFLKISTLQAGAFKLDADDHINVEVPKNLIKYVSINECETYFGAFLLQQSYL